MIRARFLLGASASLLCLAAGLAGASCADTEEGEIVSAPKAPLPEGSNDSAVIDSGADGGCEEADPNCVTKVVTCDEVWWCPSVTGVPNYHALTKVWGTSSSDVWAVGSGGTVIHWDGAAWKPVPVPPSPTPVTNTFNAVWGTGPKDVWIASSTAILFHNTGDGWVRDPLPVKRNWEYEEPIYAIWGDGDGNFRLGTRAINLYKYNDNPGPNGPKANQARRIIVDGGSGWGLMRGATSVLGFFGTAEDLWYVGDNSYRNATDKPWQRSVSMHGVFLPDAGPSDAGNPDAAPPPSWLEEEPKAVPDTLTWTEIETNTTARLNAIWGGSANDIWAVGERGVMRRMRPGQTSWEIVPSVTDEELKALWGTSASDIWAVGDNGTILHFDGTSWSHWEAAYPVGKNRPHLTGIWGSSADDVWIVGGGVALHSVGKMKGGSK
jgi:hypothetical protein